MSYSPLGIMKTWLIQSVCEALDDCWVKPRLQWLTRPNRNFDWMITERSSGNFSFQLYFLNKKCCFGGVPLRTANSFPFQIFHQINYFLLHPQTLPQTLAITLSGKSLRLKWWARLCAYRHKQSDILDFKHSYWWDYTPSYCGAWLCLANW